MVGRNADTSFSKAKRLLNPNDYSRVFDHPDARAANQYVLLLARRNNGPVHRLGLVIAKKHVRRAVTRNRIKRVAREYFRHLPKSDATMDVVLLARKGLGNLDNAELHSAIHQQWLALTRKLSRAATTSNSDT